MWVTRNRVPGWDGGLARRREAVWHEQKALGGKRQRDIDGVEGKGWLIAEVAKRIDTRLLVMLTRPGPSDCE